MWIPESEGEIVEAITAGGLAETHTFDAKAALPNKGKSKDLARDVAAMANDGGTLLYGVGEDEDGTPSVSRPIDDLARARERVDQIIRTCISEPPTVEIRAVPTQGNPTRGYLVVAVPPSPRAPHMVIVDKDHRYYGRGDTGNVRLTEGEVSRLYERRRRWEVDREALLDEAIARAPLDPHHDFGYLHLVARPVMPDEALLDRAKGDQHVDQFLNGLFSVALSAEVFETGRAYPDLSDNNTFVRRANEYETRRGFEEERRGLEADPTRALSIEVGRDGGGRLFCGCAAQSYDSSRLLYEDTVAGLTARFLSVLGGLYAAGGYLGHVDVGLAVTGLRGGVSAKLHDQLIHRFSLRPYDEDKYRRTRRFSAAVLKAGPRSAASKLVLPLIQAITQEAYDPFS